MSDNIIQLNEDLIKHDLKDLVRSWVEETLNALLDKEADELVNAQKYERSADRQEYRSGLLWSSIFVTLVAKKYHESVTLPSGLRMVYDNH